MPHIFIWRPICSTWCWNECVPLTTIRIPGICAGFMIVMIVTPGPAGIWRISSSTRILSIFKATHSDNLRLVMFHDSCIYTVQTVVSVLGRFAGQYRVSGFHRFAAKVDQNPRSDELHKYKPLFSPLHQCLCCIYVWNCMNTVCFTVI